MPYAPKPMMRGHSQALEALTSQILADAAAKWGDAVQRGDGKKGSGFSFVMLGMRLWAQELAEIDKEATRQFMDAIRDIATLDGDTAIANAENKRRAAFDKLSATLQLMESDGGTA